MKTLILSFALALIVVTVYAQEGNIRAYEVDPNAKPKQVAETVKLQTDSNDAYYQKVVKLDSTITLSSIYVRALQFMAAKNFQQNYGYEEEGKLIFTTTQDLNINNTFSNNEDGPDPYTVQFAIILDMKNGRYRYTIHNVVFYLPTGNGNGRISLYDLNQQSQDKDTRRSTKNWMGSIIRSYEKYLVTLTHELYLEIENRSATSDSKF